MLSGWTQAKLNIAPINIDVDVSQMCLAHTVLIWRRVIC